MPKFSGEYRETFTVDAPFDKAREHFGDLDTIAAAYPDLERSEKLEDMTLRFALKPKSALRRSFAGKYDCKYEYVSDDQLTWKSVGSGGNMFAKGEARFEKVGEDRTRVIYHQSMEIDMPIPRLLSKAIAPIVRKNIESGVVKYLDAMRASLRRR